MKSNLAMPDFILTDPFGQGQGQEEVQYVFKVSFKDS